MFVYNEYCNGKQSSVMQFLNYLSVKPQGTPLCKLIESLEKIQKNVFFIDFYNINTTS